MTGRIEDPTVAHHQTAATGPTAAPDPDSSAAPEADPSAASGGPDELPDREPRGAPSTGPRPWLERIGLAAVALVMAGLLAVMAVAAAAGGEWILAAMSGSGALLTVGVGLLTLIRG